MQGNKGKVPVEITEITLKETRSKNIPDIVRHGIFI